MKISVRSITFAIFIIIFLAGFLYKTSRIVLADSKPFVPSIERIEDEEIAARERESKDTSGKTTEIFSSRINRNQLGETLGAGIVLMGGWGEKALASGYFDKREAGGAIGVLAQAMGSMYAHPPASGFAWMSDTLANAGLIAKPAYAQGIGFAGLVPLLPLWKTSRNIAYSVLIIIMVIIGFMVIFRAKLDPKTVISVQAALPKIILTIILITFSYPIVGFMIDLMYLSIAIIIKLLVSGLTGIDIPSDVKTMMDPALQQTEFITGGWWKLAGSVFNFNLLVPFFKQMFLGAGGNLAGFGIASLLGAIFAAQIGGYAAIGAAIPSLIILFIIFLGLLFTLFRLTFLLLNSYIQVLISLILGPLLLLKEAIPGQSAFSEWMQNLLANLVVFPATVGVIYGSWIFTAIAWRSNLWGAPLTFTGGGGDVGGSGNPLAIVMGLGIIFLAPNLIASVKKAFHAKPTLPLTAGSAFSPITGGAQTAMGAGQQFYYAKQMLGGDERTGSKGPLGGLGDLFRKGLGVKSR